MGLLQKIAQRFTGTAVATVAKTASRLIDDRFHEAVSEITDNQIRDFRSAAKIGYARNAAVFACISAYSFEYPSARLIVVGKDGAPRPNHPVQKLLDNPNDEMSGAELALFTINYKAIGGNCYLKKLRNEFGRVVGLQPFSDADVEPIPVTDQQALSGRWVSGFRFSQSRGKGEIWSVDDVVHLKWPSIDPEKPWKGLSPISVVAREVGTLTEASRYQHALLRNDAIPRTIITTDDSSLSPDTVKLFKEQFVEEYGRYGRGAPMVLKNAKVSRLSLGLNELAFDTLHEVTEPRITSAMRVPGAIAGLFSGMKRLTYANFGTAREVFASQSLIPLRNFDAEELTSELRKDFAGEWRIIVDVNSIPAMEEYRARRSKQVVEEVKAGLLDKEEGRSQLGYAPREKKPDPESDDSTSVPEEDI